MTLKIEFKAIHEFLLNQFWDSKEVAFHAVSRKNSEKFNKIKGEVGEGRLAGAVEPLTEANTNAEVA